MFKRDNEQEKSCQLTQEDIEVLQSRVGEYSKVCLIDLFFTNKAYIRPYS